MSVPALVKAVVFFCYLVRGARGRRLDGSAGTMPLGTGANLGAGPAGDFGLDMVGRTAAGGVETGAGAGRVRGLWLAADRGPADFDALPTVAFNCWSRLVISLAPFCISGRFWARARY